ncbi:AraC family transcriptional regulator [Alcanivorax sp. 1008]|uniref:AraC family transcriptional regulator n=1 Tax=Alcanivorax sp. 1008 TaxID=2816853 RepID=UPI001E142D75|nr:AraC family transcriptional regulator [Alcanivorax sp. 1008]MCC1496964.1 AraC family transcriptional regulator [Alcanivorax sp. 1008]
MAIAAHWDFPRPIASAAILVEVGEEYGLTRAQCLAGTGIAAKVLANLEAQISADQELRLIRNLLLHLGDGLPLGLHAGRRYQATSFGIWGFAVLNARTMRQAVEVGVRYARLTTAWCQPRVLDRGEQALMTVSVDGLPADVSQFLLERDAAILISIQRSMVPLHVPLTTVTCTFPRPPYHNAVDEYFGARVAYDQPENLIGMHRSLGGLPLPSHNTAFFKRCEQECERLLDSHRHRGGGLAGRVRQSIMRHLCAGAPLERVCEDLGMHRRTLHRHLAKTGMDYASLLEETRQALAEQLLLTTDFSIEEIAYQLGYRQATNFIRAFKGWRQMTPLKWQRVHGGGRISLAATI